MSGFIDDRLLHEGLSYATYRDDWKRRAEEPMSGKDRSERKMAHYLRYNWERQEHVHDAYEPSDALRDVVEALPSQVWMVLTEPWCGDSAFLLPVIAEAAALSDDVTLRILPRDENLDVMDRYLTDGSRSIPKWVGFSEDGNEQFEWGPRPEEAAALYAQLKEETDTKAESVQQLIAYYEDGGWRALEQEAMALLQKTASTPA